ncbi:MAG: hypothetical protein WD038_09295 [Balneolales bacterium]
MNILKELEKEIELCERSDKKDITSQNKISILRSILKIKKNNEKGVAYKKMLYLLMVKICIVLIDLHHEDVIELDINDLNLISSKLGDPEASVDDLIDAINYLLDDRYKNYYSILNLRDELISLIYERLVLEKHD